MKPSDQAKRGMPIVLLGLALIVIGCGVYCMEAFESHGRRVNQAAVLIMEGNAARWTGVSIGMVGLSLLGVLLPKKGWMVAWLTIWMTLGLAVNFIEPLHCKQVDAKTRICR